MPSSWSLFSWSSHLQIYFVKEKERKRREEGGREKETRPELEDIYKQKKECGG